VNTQGGNTNTGVKWVLVPALIGTANGVGSTVTKDQLDKRRKDGGSNNPGNNNAGNNNPGYNNPGAVLEVPLNLSIMN